MGLIILFCLRYLLICEEFQKRFGVTINFLRSIEYFKPFKTLEDVNKHCDNISSLEPLMIWKNFLLI